mgnify:CR=1 FL=1
MQSLTIDIVSDIACPWCAIGYARLERALTTLKGEIEGQVEWHAFELNPDPNQQPMPIVEALSRKYGRSEAEMRAVWAGCELRNDRIRAVTSVNFRPFDESLRDCVESLITVGNVQPKLRDGFSLRA